MKYKIVKQEPYHCVPACLQMIFIRLGLPPLTQEEIGFELGFKEKLGTQCGKEQFSVSNFFKRRKLPLTFEYHRQLDKNDLIKFVKIHDVIVCFSYGTLYSVTYFDGHASLIDQIDGDYVWLACPYRNTLEKVTLNNLFDAVKSHNNMEGFWVIKRIAT